MVRSIVRPGGFAALLTSLVLAAAASADPPAGVPGERLAPEQLGPGFVEPMSAAIEREIQRRALEAEREAAGEDVHGVWAIPSRRATRFPHSGLRHVINKYGDVRMGIGFRGVVDVEAAWFSQQLGPAVTAPAVRIVGYRDGVEIGRTGDLRGLGPEPRRLAIDLRGVDRIVIEAEPAVNGAGWYALDDLTFLRRDPETGAATRVVVDFEDAAFRQTLTGSEYAGLDWETGTGDFTAQDAVPPPVNSPDELAGDEEAAGAPDVPMALGGGGTLPPRINDFQGVIRGDDGSFSFPPDTNGAAGPDHFVITVNRNFTVYDKASGAVLTSMTLGSFLPGSNGDPRVLYDQYVDRWVIIVSDFSASATLYLAVSTTDSAMGSWFKTSFATDGGSDAGCWPDYPTLGLDENGYYTGNNMVGCGFTIFAIEKAPLIAPSPALGVVTAFRGLPSEGAIQPVHSFDVPGAAYCLSRSSPTSLRVRRVTGPITAPTLVESGTVSIPSHSSPPDVPALESTVPLDHTISHRLLNAVYRNGSMWATHDIDVGGRSAVRWYEIDADTRTTVQVGTIADPSLHYFYGGIGVNVDNHVVIGFSGANAFQYAGAYYTGRAPSDPPGETAPPALIKVGAGSQNNIDGFGRNRWGDYSLTVVDPDDDFTFWTVQEYAHDVDLWGTWVAEIQPVLPTLAFSYPDGLPAFLDPSGAAIRVAIDGVNGGTLDPLTPTLHWDEGAGFVTAPLALVAPGVYDAVFPPIPCGTEVRFYLSAATTQGDARSDPPGAPDATYDRETGLGEVITLQDDFESDLGWTAENLGATSGDWQRGIPVDDPNWDYDPASDADGSGQCYLTQNETGNTDVDDGAVRLVSPSIDMSDPGSSIAYDYFLRLTNDDGTDRLLVEASDNGLAGPWLVLQTHASDGGLAWRHVEISSGDLLAAGLVPGPDVRVRFTANDGDPQSIVESGVDGFTVRRLECAPRGVPGDVDGDGDVDFNDLLAVLAAWGPCPAPPAACPADIDGDGIIGFMDLLALLSAWTG